MYLSSFVCSANSTLTTLGVSKNPMSAAAHKAIEVEFVLCRMRNPTVTEIVATGNGFDDQDAVKFGEGLRYVLHIIPICDQDTSFSRKDTSSMAPPDVSLLIRPLSSLDFVSLAAKTRL
jgi:hypothetical protein